MGSELNRQRRAANHDAVVAFLANKLRCDISTLGGNHEGFYFNPEATGFGRLYITDEALADMETPQQLIDFLSDHRMVDHLRRGRRIRSRRINAPVFR